jgi:hypothetical protein
MVSIDASYWLSKAMTWARPIRIPRTKPTIAQPVRIPPAKGAWSLRLRPKTRVLGGRMVNPSLPKTAVLSAL